jgi:hypothetical protein
MTDALCSEARSCVTWISHTGRCIGVPDLRKSFYSKGWVRIEGKPDSEIPQGITATNIGDIDNDLMSNVRYLAKSPPYSGSC